MGGVVVSHMILVSAPVPIGIGIRGLGLGLDNIDWKLANPKNGKIQFKV